MKKLYLLIILIVLVILPSVYAATDCDISLDNSSWIDIQATTKAGCIDDTESIGYIQNLQADTDYFIRCKDTDTSYNILQQKTKQAGFDDTMISIIVGLSMVLIFFAVMGFIVKPLGIKILGYAIALIQLVNIMFILYLNETGASLLATLRINFLTILIVAFGIGMGYLINFLFKIMNPADDLEGEQRKWQK